MIKTLPNGDQISYDGTYYDFRDKDARSMIKLWVPSHVDTVRGIFISGHGGGTGDSRDFARELNFRSFAARLGFGAAGLHTFPGRKVYDEGGRIFFKALDAFAELGHHPELANVPFCIFGSSNGGATSYGFINHAPKRAICFVANVCAWFNPEVPAEDALQVPGIINLGMYDPFCKEEAGVKTAEDLVKAARARGARWSLVVEQKGHEDGYAFDTYVKLAEQAIALRYPDSEDPSKGPVTLKNIPEEEGWLVDMDSWDSGLTRIASYSDYEGNKTTAGWVVNEDMAALYRAAATHENPIVLSVEGIAPIHNPHVEPGTMFSIGGPIVSPGRELKLMCDLHNFTDWQKIEFFKNGVKMGETSPPVLPECKLTTDPKDTIISLTAIGTDSKGEKRASGPFYLIVRDPEISIEDSKTESEYKDCVKTIGTQAVDGKAGPESPGPVLKAPGLSPEQENRFNENTDSPCPFWNDIQDEIRMTPAKNGNSGFSVVTTVDARMNVKAAHTARGLYLFFEVTDDHFMEADPRNYMNVDALDVLIDSSPASHAADSANDLELINLSWGITLTTKQIQSAFGNRDLPPFFQINYADPWDFTQYRPTHEQGRKYRGIEIRHFRISNLVRVQEWFLPWQEVGNPGPDSEPPVGTRFAFAPGYNDMDPGRYNTKQLRWVDGNSPWQFKAGDDAPRGWGDIEIC